MGCRENQDIVGGSKLNDAGSIEKISEASENTISRYSTHKSKYLSKWWWN